MRAKDWGMEILRVDNGYKLRFAAFNDETGEDGIFEEVIEDGVGARRVCELKSGQMLLWRVGEHFAFGLWSKHDAERVRVVREKKDAEGNWKEVEED